MLAPRHRLATGIRKCGYGPLQSQRIAPTVSLEAVVNAFNLDDTAVIRMFATSTGTSAGAVAFPLST